jgi:competence protein ComEC
MHIVAVSGSNVTIVVNILLPVAIWIGLHRRRAFWVVTLGLLFFVGFVGFSSSVLRAAFMGWLVLLARHIGRIAWTDRLLLFAASVLNLFNPWALAFDAGFALSFLATWGLLAWTPIFSKRLRFFPQTFGLREAMATTCGATLMTAPYLAWVFGSTTLIGLVTNALALPLLPWIMIWGAVAVVLHGLSGLTAVSWPVFGLLSLLIRVAHIADKFNWLNLKFIQLNIWIIAATYLLIWQIWRQLREKPGLSTTN